MNGNYVPTTDVFSTALWNIEMPVEEPSTASQLDNCLINRHGRLSQI